MDTSSEPSGLVKLPTNTVYIFNMSEDVWPFIAAMSDKKARDFEIEENADLGDREIFSFCAEDNIIFVVPRPVDAAFINYYESIVGQKNFRFLVTKRHSGIICEDIIGDPEILEELSRAANGQKRLTMKSYATSQPFLELIRVLKDRGLTVITPDTPEEEDAWTINFYGSKSGIRQLSQQSRAVEPDFIMPDGVIVSGIIDASRIAAKKYIREHGVVIKTNKGHSGAGLLLLREGELPGEYDICQQNILKLLQKESYWSLFPIVVESLISVSPTVGGGYPNVEFRILKNGHVEFLYMGGMRVTKQGVFRGMEINSEVISDQAAARIVDTGFFISEQYRAAGYRGYFDVDFVSSKNGNLYVTETNVRRTGGTHVFALAERLFGKDFMYLTYVLSNNTYELPPGKRFTFHELHQTLSPILFDKMKREGLILTSENVLSYGRIGYIIFARTKKRAYELENEMETILRA